MKAGQHFGWWPRKSRPQTYWKASLRSAPPLAFVLFGTWNQQVRVFRWKWLAQGAALRHLFFGRHLHKEAVVERYSPGANIVPLAPHSGGQRNDPR